MSTFPTQMRIIEGSSHAVRVVCGACGSHRVVEKRRLGVFVRCSTCDALRVVDERRARNSGRTPERRMLRPSV